VHAAEVVLPAVQLVAHETLEKAVRKTEIKKTARKIDRPRVISAPPAGYSTGYPWTLTFSKPGTPQALLIMLILASGVYHY
jgi:hypothetical protein